MKMVVDHLLCENDSDLEGYNKAIQCFLNKKYKSNLQIDGYIGDNTKKIIQRFQSEKSIYPADGVWGRETMSKLDKNELNIFNQCISQYGDLIDRFENFIGL